jgi:hypothetical protein
MRLPAIKQLLDRHPVALGLGITGALLLGLFIQTIVLDRFPVIFGPEGSPDDFRVAVNHCLLAGYLVGAYFYLLRGARNTAHELDKVLEPTSDPSDVDWAGHIGVKALLVWGLIGLLLTVFSPYLAPSPEIAWDPSAWSPEVWWHRVLGLFTGWWFGWFVLAVWTTSTQVSRLADRIGPVDLLDLSPFSPFVKQGLLTALLIVGLVSIMSLRLLEPGQRLTVVISVGLSLPLALLGLLLPVRGARERIREAKGVELAWTRDAIRDSRTHLHNLFSDASSDASSGQMADLTAYQRLVEDVPEWPFRTSTLVQVLLYLLIPVASWIGGLLIENGLGYFFG